MKIGNTEDALSFESSSDKVKINDKTLATEEYVDEGVGKKVPVVTVVPELTSTYSVPANATQQEMIYEISVGETVHNIIAEERGQMAWRQASGRFGELYACGVCCQQLCRVGDFLMSMFRNILMSQQPGKTYVPGLVAAWKTYGKRNDDADRDDLYGLLRERAGHKAVQLRFLRNERIWRVWKHLVECVWFCSYRGGARLLRSIPILCICQLKVRIAE